MSALPLALDAGIEQFEHLRAIFSFSSNSEVAFRRNAADALRSIFKSLQTSVAQAVEAKDAEDFEKRRGIALVTYVKLLHAGSLITETEIDDEDQFAVVACHSLDRLHEDLISAGIANFGLEAGEVIPAVAEAILDGLDACQLAYGTLREGLELRHESELSLSDRIEWDEEDQALLNDAERTRTPAS